MICWDSVNYYLQHIIQRNVWGNNNEKKQKKKSNISSKTHAFPDTESVDMTREWQDLALHFKRKWKEIETSQIYRQETEYIPDTGSVDMARIDGAKIRSSSPPAPLSGEGHLSLTQIARGGPGSTEVRHHLDWLGQVEGSITRSSTDNDARIFLHEGEDGGGLDWQWITGSFYLRMCVCVSRQSSFILHNESLSSEEW